ncbi:diguanylate cyclase/phosphodiesterase [Pseudomonas chlororaphis subsp. piscium]|nr:diguanylate cyclase/phosphodiesterase [Pseudomonas chlororaphis subsp. piscium]
MRIIIYEVVISNNQIVRAGSCMINTKTNSLTLEEVMRAVADLKKQGLKVTLTAVRNQTGRGSYTTISKFLKDASSVEEENLSPSERLAQFPDQIRAALLSIYKELIEAAKAETTKKRDEIQEFEGRLRARWAANVKEKIRALRSLEIETNVCAELRVELRQATQKIWKDQEIINNLTARLVKTESANEQLLELTEKLKSDIKKLQRNIEHFEQQTLQQRHAENQMHLLKVAKLEQNLMNSQARVLELSMALAGKYKDGETT